MKTPEEYIKVNLLEGTTFKLKMQKNYWHKNDVIELANGTKPMQLKVTKVYKFNLWRRLLFKLGFSFKSMEMVQIKSNRTYE